MSLYFVFRVVVIPTPTAISNGAMMFQTTMICLEFSIVSLLAFTSRATVDHAPMLTAFTGIFSSRSSVSRISQAISSFSSRNSDMRGQGQMPIDMSTHNSLPIPPIFLAMFGLSNKPSPLNLQTLSIQGPWFQGWLVRSIDHVRNVSIIVIVGSFSAKCSDIFDEHYIFCAVQTSSSRIHCEAFPSPDSVTMSGLGAIKNSKGPLPYLDITWSAAGIGEFRFCDDSCSVDFGFDNLVLKLRTKNRIPWSTRAAYDGGPEGWLGHTKLLPCHYFVHSVGSNADYDIRFPVAKFPSLRGKLCGRAFAHIEGNSGTFFPSGWVWAQAVNDDNTASLSFVAGKFVIGCISPTNLVLYLRMKTKVAIFRSTDFDSFEYDMDGITGVVKIEAKSSLKQNRVVLTIESSAPVSADCFGNAIYIPTPTGFSNKPGCRETYTATASVAYFEYCSDLKNYSLKETISFPLTALEFGGSFQGIRIKR